MTFKALMLFSIVHHHLNDLSKQLSESFVKLSVCLVQCAFRHYSYVAYTVMVGRLLGFTCGPHSAGKDGPPTFICVFYMCQTVGHMLGQSVCMLVFFNVPGS